jgi:hypothetical protein
LRLCGGAFFLDLRHDSMLSLHLSRLWLRSMLFLQMLLKVDAVDSALSVIQLCQLWLG